ncbi:hypothetical protein M514_11326, partial [Trichuris suis]
MLAKIQLPVTNAGVFIVPTEVLSITASTSQCMKLPGTTVAGLLRLYPSAAGHSGVILRIQPLRSRCFEDAFSASGGSLLPF